MSKDRNINSLKKFCPVNLTDEKMNSHLDQEIHVKNASITKKLPVLTRQATPYFTSDVIQTKNCNMVNSATRMLFRLPLPIPSNLEVP